MSCANCGHPAHRNGRCYVEGCGCDSHFDSFSAGIGPSNSHSQPSACRGISPAGSPRPFEEYLFWLALAESSEWESLWK